MHRVLLFNAIQFAASAYALARGGAPERLVGGALLLAALGTRFVQSDLSVRFVGVEKGVLLIDAALLAVLILVALAADRFWPMWVAVLHAAGTGAHLVRFVDGGALRMVYAILVAGWSYPIVALLVVGTVRHRRRLAHGGDLDWSRSGRRDGAW